MAAASGGGVYTRHSGGGNVMLLARLNPDVDSETASRAHRILLRRPEENIGFKFQLSVLYQNSYLPYPKFSDWRRLGIRDRPQLHVWRLRQHKAELVRSERVPAKAESLEEWTRERQSADVEFRRDVDGMKSRSHRISNLDCSVWFVGWAGFT